MPDHRLPGEAELERVGDRDDLHHAALDQPLHALAHRGLREAHDLADGGVRAASVLLQLLDDGLGDVVEGHGPLALGCHAAHAVRTGARGQRIHGNFASDFVAERHFPDGIACDRPGAAWHDPLRGPPRPMRRDSMTPTTPPDPATRSTLSRRGLLKAGGVAGFGALSLAALKLPFFVDRRAPSRTPRPAAPTDLSAEQKALIISNWTAYIDPRNKEGSTMQVFQEQTGITVTYNVDVNDNSEFYAKVRNQLGSCEPIDRDMIILTDWMAARMIDLGWIQPLDAKTVPEPPREPDPAAARQGLGPRPAVPRPVAERPDRHRLQRRRGPRGEELRGAAHPRGPQGPDHAAHRDARHDGLRAQGDRRRPGGLHRRPSGPTRSTTSRRSSPTASSASSPATTTCRTSRTATPWPARRGRAT